MENYIIVLKELRKIMKKSSAIRYWGTLILLIFAVSLVTFIWKLPEIIPFFITH